MKSYSDLIRLASMEERFDYLALGGAVGGRTFGSERFLNQRFYTSKEWRDVRRQVIIRDNGCDLGIIGFEIHSGLYIHHMNPIQVEQLKRGDHSVLDPEYLITVSLRTHNAIHYGDRGGLPVVPRERRPGDTKLW